MAPTEHSRSVRSTAPYMLLNSEQRQYDPPKLNCARTSSHCY